MFESLSSPNPSYRFSREKGFDPESRRHAPKVPQVECDQNIRPSIYRRFQDHLIVWITELRPPQEMRFHRLRHRNHRIQKYIDLLLGERSRQPVLRFLTNMISLPHAGASTCPWNAR